MTIKLLTKSLSWTLKVTLSFLRLRFLLVLFMRETETNQMSKLSFLRDMFPRHCIIGSRRFETTWLSYLQSERPNCESLKTRISDFFCNISIIIFCVLYVLFGFYVTLHICFSSFFLSNCYFCVFFLLI